MKILRVKMEWEREDCLLQSVSAVLRCLFVVSRIEKMSAAQVTGRSSTPWRRVEGLGVGGETHGRATRLQG